MVRVFLGVWYDVNMKMTQEEWEKSVTWIGIVAGCVIKKDGRYLLVQEKQKKVYGFWNVPAGYVDKDEEIKHAAIREAKEETGFDVELEREIGLYHEEVKKPVKHIFKAHIIGGELKVQEDEILDAKWLTFEEVKELKEQGKLRADWILDAVSKVDS